MKPLAEWVEEILAIKQERTLDEIYRAMHCFYSKEEILTVWKPEKKRKSKVDEEVKIWEKK